MFVETAPGEFDLNDAARGLQVPSCRHAWDLDALGDRYARVWIGLLEMVRTGAAGYHKIFGLPFFRDLEANPEVGAGYQALLAEHEEYLPAMEFDIEGGWASVGSVVHLGGESGTRLAALLQEHPHLHGTLLELPRAVEMAGELQVFERAGVADRVTLAAQSYFNPLPPGADVYLLHRALRPWPDPLAIRLLRRCAEAAATGGRVVVVDDVSVESDSDRDQHLEVLLEMLIGGKQVRTRTPAEFERLAAEAGLRITASGRRGDDPYVVECRPAESREPVVVG